MTEPDTLDRNIRGLKDLQRLAWERLADPALTAFERRELRSQLKQSAAELRKCLVIMSEHTRIHERYRARDDALCGRLSAKPV